MTGDGDDIVEAFTDAIDKLAPARRDPVAEQSEAARVFEERTGRKSTDPAPAAFLGVEMVNGRLVAHTYGDDTPRDPNAIDHFERAGIERVRHGLDEVRLRVPAGTPIRDAVGELLDSPEAKQMLAEATERAERRASAIEADVVEVDPEAYWYHCTIDPTENTMTIDLEPCRDRRCCPWAHIGLVLPQETDPS